MDFTMCFRILKGAALIYTFVGLALSDQSEKVGLPQDMKLSLNDLAKKGYEFNATVS